MRKVFVGVEFSDSTLKTFTNVYLSNIQSIGQQNITELYLAVSFDLMSECAGVESSAVFL